MLDYAALYRRERAMQELVSDLTVADLRAETDEIYDTIERLIADCTDADVTFQPIDPKAHDPFASDPNAVNQAWTLGHVIVHLTASCEESAFLAAEMARGVQLHGRSRYEVPWETVTTMAQIRQRLAESRRMLHASLQMWPDQPHLDYLAEPWPGASPVDARGRYALGLAHAWDHLGQIEEIVRQARAARG
ncbi:DinB family protein [Chloroflexus sp.]|uniref:DinB family protein n=1 Tax=Chloroflexus sp. TaxID=1904827 RepID=UPI0026173F5E|nr:DinB family protein [uncultured Chloroflexus sp.]